MLSTRARALFMWLIPDSEWLPDWSDATLLGEAKARGLLDKRFLRKHPNVGRATIANISAALSHHGIEWSERHTVHPSQWR